MLPTVVFAATYASLAYYGSGQLLEMSRLLGYVCLNVLVFLSGETIGHIIGVILYQYQQIMFMATIGVMASMIMFSNYFLFIKNLPYALQIVSEFSLPRYMFNMGLLLVYGLNRCSTHEKSIVLLKYDLNDEQLVIGFYKLLLYLIVTRALSYLFLYLKTDTKISLRILFKQKSKLNDEIEMKDQSSNKVYLDKKMSMAVYLKKMSDIDMIELEVNSEIINNEKKLISIAWTDLTLCIPKSLFVDQKVLLKQINGFFEFGTINALMGQSGAGKTTLLNSINGVYNQYLTAETTIFLSKFRRIKTCFINQNQKDHILNGLTAKQAVTYASKLKNSEKDFDHKKNVENIMNELLISNTYDTNVENCSGGEQKRLIIAMELTSGLKPNLLCIDEPTSGLDSNAAEVVSN